MATHSKSTHTHTQAHAVPTPPAGQPRPHKPTVSRGRRTVYGLLYAIWTVVSFACAQLLVVGAVWVGALAHVSLPVILNDTVLQTLLSIVVYVLTIALAIGVPWVALRQRLGWKDVGLAQQLPRWRDIGLAPVAFVAALICTGIAVYVVGLLLPGVDMDTKQQVGFENITQRYEMILAFFTLVVLAPLCEEFLFRGYLYGRVRTYYNAFWAIVLTSLVFGLMHVYAGPGMPLQWNVMIATTVLALFIGGLREYTGSIWAGILVHMLKNGVAFFVLFVAPLLGVSLVQ